MAFITLGTAAQLQIKVPTIGSTDWADTMRTDTFLKIAQHQHTGAGDGSQLGTGSIAADSITGAKIRLDNNEYLKARNAADSGNINIIKVDTSDEIVLGADVASLIMKHDTYIQADNAGGTATNLIKLDTNDNIALGNDLANAQIISDTYITSVDNAGTGSVNLLKANTSDQIALGADLANAAIINDTSIQARNNADSGYVDIVKVNTSDKLVLGAELTGASILNNVALQHRNAADSAYIETIKVNASDKVELGATVVSASIESTATSLIDTLDTAVTLTDNTALLTDTGIITLASGESCSVHYRITRGSDIESGVVRFSYGDIIPTQQWRGDDTGVTFTILSEALNYQTTNTGDDGSMTYVVIKE